MVYDMTWLPTGWKFEFSYNHWQNVLNDVLNEYKVIREGWYFK